MKLNQDDKERLTKFLINDCKWNELKFCICDIRCFYGLKTTLKVLEFDADLEDLLKIQKFLGVEKSFVSAKDGDVVIWWK